MEGSRLGMDMTGVDLNPVAWFVVKTELAQVEKKEVEALLADIEAEVKPQIMPFYACDCPRGHRGRWTKRPTGKVMDDDFDPLALTPSNGRLRVLRPRDDLRVLGEARSLPGDGLWPSHSVMTKPVMAVKKLSVKYWPYKCRNGQCARSFDIEEQDVRMAPGVPQVTAESERPFVVPSMEHDLAPPKKRRFDVSCPTAGHEHGSLDLPVKSKKKKVELSLLVHPQWLAGESSVGPDGSPFGGSVTDSAGATAAWKQSACSQDAVA